MSLGLLKVASNLGMQGTPWVGVGLFRGQGCLLHPAVGSCEVRRSLQG